ncbi:MAG: hypothetical protein DMG13_01270 [Acidobacteria bacterium]|nr:MAG: hypothetical protein DMG13_01270 [Acidobacteriota bacterium]
MKRKMTGSLAVVFALLSPLEATTVRRLSLDDLVSKSRSIVIGHVLESRTFWTDDHKLIMTAYTVQVQENIKGNTPQIIVITTIGGQVGNTVLHVAGMPMFENGESAVLFLEQSGAYTTVVGLNQGKFPVSNGEVSNTVSGLSFPDGLATKPMKMSLDEFKRQIQLRLGR